MPPRVRPVLSHRTAALAARSPSPPAAPRASRCRRTTRPTQGRSSSPQRCSGCHTLTAAGTQGSANRALRNQGPNLDQRAVSYEDALYAIRNGGFSGAIMPQNIVVGDEAEAVADFVAEYAGTRSTARRSPPTRLRLERAT